MLSLPTLTALSQYELLPTAEESNWWLMIDCVHSTWRPWLPTLHQQCAVSGALCVGQITLSAQHYSGAESAGARLWQSSWDGEHHQCRAAATPPGQQTHGGPCWPDHISLSWEDTTDSQVWCWTHVSPGQHLLLLLRPPHHDQLLHGSVRNSRRGGFSL